MLDREYTIPECKIIFTGGKWTDDATKEHRLIPLVRPMEPEPRKREVVSRFRRAEPLRRERPAVIPREVPEKPKAAKMVAAPKPPRVAKVKPARISHFPRVVGRWLLACEYRYCGPGLHVLCVGDFYAGSPRCKDCHKARVDKWRRANLATVAAVNREYRKRNPEAVAAATAKWQATNHERRLAQQKRWYDRVRADPVRWAARLANSQKRKASKRTATQNC